jgi:DNA-binding NarL/FixJ family response regulator
VEFIKLRNGGVRIAIIEDHQMFRELLKKVCIEDLHYEVVAEAGDGYQAIEAVKETTPDLVLLDLHLPRLDGFAVVEEVRKIDPRIRILVLSSHCDDYTVFRLDGLHVHGFVDKNTNSVVTLRTAIQAVDMGKVWYSETFQRVKSTRCRDPHSFDKVLTDRERTVLSLLGDSWSDQEIAVQLSIFAETARKHRFNILRKLDLATSSQLRRYARDHGFTPAARL